VIDENGDLLVDSYNILNRWKNYFSQLFNVHNVRQIDVHSAEPLVPGPSRFEVEIAIAKLKKYKLQCSDQILAEPIQAGGKILLSVFHKLINSIWNKEDLPDQWKTDCNYRGVLLLSTSYKMLSNILPSRLSPYADELLGIINVGFDVTD
jgi:hypothetical protein